VANPIPVLVPVTTAISIARSPVRAARAPGYYMTHLLLGDNGTAWLGPPLRRLGGCAH
jgi:hypothetical protein